MLTRILRTRFGLDHIELEGTEPSTELHYRLLEDLDANTILSHGKKLALTYRERLPRGYVELRSTYFAFGRAHYRRKFRDLRRTGRLDEKFDGRLAAKLYKSAVNDERVVSLFAAFLEEQEFDRVQSLGYDPLDFFLWEHRFGCWHSCIPLEFDISHPTLSLFNHRELIGTMFSTPLAARQSQALARRIIEIPDSREVCRSGFLPVGRSAALRMAGMPPRIAESTTTGPAENRTLVSCTIRRSTMYLAVSNPPWSAK